MVPTLFIVTCALGASALLIRRPQTLLAGAVLLVLLFNVFPEAFRLDVAGMSVYREDLITVAMALIVFVQFMRRDLQVPPLSIMAPFYLLVLELLLVSITSPPEDRERRHLLRDAGVFAAHISILFAYTVIRTPRVLVRWCLAVFFVSITASSYAIMMRLLGIESPTFFEGCADVGTAFGSHSRAYGVPGSCYFAMYGTVIGMALLVRAQELWSLLARRLFAIGTAICCLQLLLYMGRAYWMGATASLIALAFTFAAKDSLKIVVGAVCITLVGVLVLSIVSDNLPGQLARRLASMFSAEAGGSHAQSTREGRISEFRQVVQEIRLHGLATGRGLGARARVVMDDGTVTADYHNGMATALLRSGVVGVALWCWFITNVIRSALSFRGETELSQISVLGRVFLCAFLAAAGYSLGAFGPPMMPTLLDGMMLGLGLRALSMVRFQGAVHAWVGPGSYTPSLQAGMRVGRQLRG